MLIVQWHRT